MCLNSMSINLNMPSKSFSVGPESPKGKEKAQRNVQVTKETELDEISNPLESKLQETAAKSPDSQDPNKQAISNMMRRSVNL